MCANMLQLGWKCKGWTTKGRPNWFRQKWGDTFYDIVSANHDGTDWRAEMWTGRMIPIRKAGRQIAVMAKIEGPRLRGPVALATWLAVEIRNGCIRIDQSKSPARSSGAVLRDDPPEPESAGDPETAGRAGPVDGGD